MADDTASDDGTGEETEEREQGVDFGALAEELEARDYPTTTDDIISEYGDHELELADGTRTVEEVLAPQEGDEEYESAEQVRQAILNMVGAEAVGRQGYSDRGSGTAPDEENESV